MTRYFLMSVVVAAFAQAWSYPEWYTNLSFVAALAGYCLLEHLNPPVAKIENAQIQEMKGVIEGLAGQIGATSNKLNGLRMNLGIREK